MENLRATVTETAAQNQKTVESLRGEVSSMSTTIHTPQRQINGMETVTLNNSNTNNNINNNNNNNNSALGKKPNNGQKKPNDTRNQNTTGNGTGAKRGSCVAAAASADTSSDTTTNIDKAFTKVQKKKPTPLFNVQTPRLDRQLRIDSTQPISDLITNDQILEVVSRATAPQKFSFCSARQTPNGSITLETGLTSSAEEGVAYLQEITNALTIIDIMATNIYANTRMSQFVIHGILTEVGTDFTPEEMNPIEEEIRAFTSFNLTVPLRWLAGPETIKNKAKDSIIGSFLGKVKFLGMRYMILFNRSCQVEKARPDHRLTRYCR